MKKFLVLLKKEIRELMTPQIILPMLITIVMFVVLGNVIGKETKKADTPKKLAYINLDNSTFSDQLADVLPKDKYIVEKISNQSKDKAIEIAREQNIPLIIVIPENFNQSVKDATPLPIETYLTINNFSMTGIKLASNMDIAVATIEQITSNEIIKNSGQNQLLQINLSQPISIKQNVTINNKTTSSNPIELMNFVSQQTTFIPIILFIVIIFAAQMIATAIANEKENKTLETLLSLPIPRQYIVSAKMIGAGIMALLTAIIYIFSFRYYMNSFMASGSSANQSAVQEAMRQLGLQLHTQDYILLGISLFFGILAALSMAIILGVFAEDIKSVQSLITPLMILITIPYFATLFVDIDTVAPIFRYILYAIPFTHPFLASKNIYFHQYWALFGGIIYMFIFFLVFVYIASRIFSTDKIITMKLNFNKKK